MLVISTSPAFGSGSDIGSGVSPLVTLSSLQAGSAPSTGSVSNQWKPGLPLSLNQPGITSKRMAVTPDNWNCRVRLVPLGGTWSFPHFRGHRKARQDCDASGNERLECDAAASFALAPLALSDQRGGSMVAGVGFEPTTF